MFLVRDRETLVAARREQGVDYLAPSAAKLGQPIDDEIFYMAAKYLQTLWRIRLGHYLQPFPDLPESNSNKASGP